MALLGTKLRDPGQECKEEIFTWSGKTKSELLSPYFPAFIFLSFCFNHLSYLSIIGWHRDGSLDDEFDTETTFADRKSQSHKAYSYSKDSTSGFEWRQGFSWTNQSQRSKNWDDESSCDEEPLIVKSRSQRTVLGLPTFGPLKISDVKNA